MLYKLRRGKQRDRLALNTRVLMRKTVSCSATGRQRWLVWRAALKSRACRCDLVFLPSRCDSRGCAEASTFRNAASHIPTVGIAISIVRRAEAADATNLR